jgi:glycosyltransferase involved in cell wall biosynthesis
MNKNKIDITICIPTYNGEKRLPEVLDRLRSQINLEQISSEIIVVDNNSSDQTAKIVQEYQVNWPTSYALRYVLEETQGAAFARLRGVKEAKGEIIGFLDDDNIPELDWVAQAYAFGQEHPQAGAYGSRIYGDYEVTPPPNFSRIAPFLAITDRGSKVRCYEPKKRLLPPSAGLVVRKQVWLESVPAQPILTGRVPGNMITGEDLEVLRYIQSKGWEIWYNPAMTIHHKIPRQRLEKDYLISFFRGIGLGRHILRMLNYKPWQRPWAFFAYILNDSRKILLHLFKNFNKFDTEIVVACEYEMYISSLISPFYLLRKGYIKSLFMLEL